VQEHTETRVAVKTGNKRNRDMMLETNNDTTVQAKRTKRNPASRKATTKGKKVNSTTTVSSATASKSTNKRTNRARPERPPVPVPSTVSPSIPSQLIAVETVTYAHGMIVLANNGTVGCGETKDDTHDELTMVFVSLTHNNPGVENK
jgi:hypothetical protein